jgi:lipoprotein-anchoring transpeptidase ErfK/SrfK
MSGKRFWSIVLLELAVLAILGGVLLRRHVDGRPSAAASSAQIKKEAPTDEPVMVPVRPAPTRPAPSRRPSQPASRHRTRRTRMTPPLPALANPAILIEKARRRLTVYDNGRPVKQYVVAIGGQPGDKVREGDRRTPEGTFYVCAKLGEGESSYTRSLRLSYPNIAHANRGLRDGLISNTQWRDIRARILARQEPPQDTPLGSNIMIHGRRDGYDRRTLGCVALDDRDIIALFPRIPVGTPVTIRP